MAKIKYATAGTCSREIIINLDKGKVKDVTFVGGCAGNLQAVARLAKGRDVEELISLVEGIQCRDGTSCPDQLAKALRAWGEKDGETRATVGKLRRGGAEKQKKTRRQGGKETRR